MKVTIYARKSTDEPESVEAQIAAARAFCDGRGWTVMQEFSDSGVSGGEFIARPGFNALMDAVQAKRKNFDTLVIRAVDRLGRDQFRTNMALQEIIEHDVRVFTYTDGNEIKLDSFADKLMLSVKTGSAEDYKAQVSVNTKAKLHEKARAGHAVNAPVFGYRLEQRDKYKVNVIDPEQAATVVRIFELCADGLGNRRIVTKLNEEHRPAPTARGWSKAAVKSILRREHYIGHVTYGRTKNAAKGGHAERRVAVDPRNWYTTLNEDLRIISDELWRRVGRRRAKTNQTYVRNQQGHLQGRPESGLIASHLMNGFGRCFECGGPLIFVHRGGKNPHRYYCSNKREGRPCKNGRGILKRALDEAVRMRLDTFLTEEEDLHWQVITERAAQFRKDTERPAEVVKNEQRELSRLEAEVGRLVAALAGGKESLAIVTAIQDKEAKATALREKLAAPVAFNPTREELREGMVSIRMFRNGDKLTDDPSKDYLLYEPSKSVGPMTMRSVAEVRWTLRRIGVERIVVIPDGDGWRFDANANLAGLFKGKDGKKGDPEALRGPPLIQYK